MTTRNHYPGMPPRLEGESDDAYTNRLTGYSEAHDGPPRPYDHARGRQCSLGWHSECSQRIDGSTIGATGQCECPHHADPRLAAALPHITAFVLSNLTDEEESALFWCTEDITSIDALDWIAERVIEGRELWRCEECDGSGRIYEDGMYGSRDSCESHGFVLAEDMLAEDAEY